MTHFAKTDINYSYQFDDNNGKTRLGKEFCAEILVVAINPTPTFERKKNPAP